MNEEAFIGFIKSSIPAAFVTNEGIEKILASFESFPLEEGEILLKNGKISGYYVLLAGHMRSFTHNGSGSEVTTNFYSGPRVVFEAASFFLRQPSTETIVALSRCEGYFTTFEKLNAIFHEVPEFREFGRAILVREFVAAQKQKLAIINLPAQERYLQLLQGDTGLLKFAQLRHIASFLGITDTSLSRIRRDISRK